MLLETEDVQVLGEALRFFRSLLHAEESYISGLESDTATDTPRDPGWIKRLAAHPAAMARLLFIAQNSLRAALARQLRHYFRPFSHAEITQLCTTPHAPWCHVMVLYLVAMLTGY